jgi:predicted dehydrogenase
MPLNISVIGCGSISRFHFAAFEKIGVNVLWVCDLNQSAADPYAHKFNARYTDDFRQAIDDPQVEAVFVLTHSSTHKPICLYAIHAGKAIVCEKTLAENPDDAFEIIQAARNQKTIFYTSYMKRFIPAVEKAKSLLPKLGQLFSTYIRTYQPWGDLWSEAPTEGFFSKTQGSPSQVVKFYGGGILVCGGSHLLDLVGFFNGRPTRLYAKMVQPYYLDFDLLASAIIETPNGVVHYEAAAHPLSKIGFLRDGWDERIEINGTLGRLEIFSALWDAPYTKDSLLIHYDQSINTVTEYRFGFISPFERAVAFFIDNIKHGTQGEQPNTTGYDVDELIAHMVKSASLKQAIDIQWKIFE